MGKKILISILCLGIVAVLYIVLSHPASPTKPAISDKPSIPAASLEESICERVTAQFGDCKRIIMFDANSKLVFAVNSSGIFPVLTNNEFTKFEKFIFPIMDFQEFKEERVERGPIDWRAKNNVQKNFSVIYGFAEDAAKTIVITSEGNIQPNRFFVRDNLWVWYAAFPKDKIKLPVKVTVYDSNGQIIFGGNEKKE